MVLLIPPTWHMQEKGCHVWRPQGHIADCLYRHCNEQAAHAKTGLLTGGRWSRGNTRLKGRSEVPYCRRSYFMPDTGQRQAGQEEVDSEHDPGMRKEAH